MLWVKAISAPITAGDSAPAKFPSPLKIPPAVALTRGWVALASRAKMFGAPVPHIKVLKLIAAMMASGVSRCITAASPTAAPAIEITRTSPEVQAGFAAIRGHPSVVPAAELAKAALPELQADWLTAIEAGWATNVGN